MKRLSLGQITNIAEIVGTVAIVVSLILVGLQIRQNTNQIEATSFQTGLRFIQTLDDLTATRESAELVIKGLNDFDALSQIDKALFDSKLTDLFNDFFIARPALVRVDVQCGRRPEVLPRFPRDTGTRVRCSDLARRALDRLLLE